MRTKPNFRRATVHTYPQTARRRFEAQQAAWNTVANTTDRELRPLLETAVDEAQTRDDPRLHVVQAVEPDFASRINPTDAFGPPRFDTTKRPFVDFEYFTPTGPDTSLETVAAEFRHALRPQAIHAFVGP